MELSARNITELSNLYDQLIAYITIKKFYKTFWGKNIWPNIEKNRKDILTYTGQEHQDLIMQKGLPIRKKGKAIEVFDLCIYILAP